MRGKIVQFLTTLWQGFVKIVKMGWQVVMHGVEIRGQPELCQVLDEVVKLSYTPTRTQKIVIFMRGSFDYLKSCFRAKRNTPRMKSLVINVPKNWMRGKRKHLSEAEYLVL